MSVISGLSQTPSQASGNTTLVWAHNLGVGDFVNAIPLFRELRLHTKQLHLATNPAYHLLVLGENLFDVLSGEFSPPPLQDYDLLIEIVVHPRKFRRTPVRTKRHLPISLMGDRFAGRLVYRHLQDQLRASGFGVPDTRPSLSLMDEDSAWAASVLDGHGMGEDSDSLRIGIHPGANFLPKLWDASRFALLSDRLQESYGAQIAMFIGPEEEGLMNQMDQSMATVPTVIVRECNLGQTAAMVRQMDLFVSCDSGLMHIAAAQSIPLVAIFGPTHPDTWGPAHEAGITVFARPVTCPPCGYSIAKKCSHRNCLKDISVETVLIHIERAIEHALARNRGPQSRYVWNENELEYRTVKGACGEFLSSRELVSLCRWAEPATRGELAAMLEPGTAAHDMDSTALVEDLCAARLLIPSWYPPTRRQNRERQRSFSGSTSRAKPRLVFAIARETDASELLTLIFNLPEHYNASVLVSSRHPLMGTVCRRHAIPYLPYETTDGFYEQCDQLQADVIIWASYANIDRYETGYRHIFVDHGMHSKGHFMSSLRMGRYDFNEFDMACVPNRFKYERLEQLGYAGQLELTGYLKGDMYHRAMSYRREEILRDLGVVSDRPLALYCPTNIKGIGTGTLEKDYKWVLQAAHEAGVSLLVRPHEEDYVRRPGLLEQIRTECRPGQVIVLDWEAPLWLNMADVFIGDAGSINIEAVMAGIPAVLLPAGQAHRTQDMDPEIADLHQRIVHSAIPTVATATALVHRLRHPLPPIDGTNLLAYFNDCFDGRTHVRFFGALDKLLESDVDPTVGALPDEGSPLEKVRA